MAGKTTIRINQSARKVAKQYKSILQSSGVDLYKLLMFGSQISGKAQKWSDIDICVVSPKLGKDWMKESVWLTELASKVDDRIEPHPYSVKDFMVEEDPFAYEINKTGIEI